MVHALETNRYRYLTFDEELKLKDLLNASALNPQDNPTLSLSPLYSNNPSDNSDKRITSKEKDQETQIPRIWIYKAHTSTYTGYIRSQEYITEQTCRTKCPYHKASHRSATQFSITTQGKITLVESEIERIRPLFKDGKIPTASIRLRYEQSQDLPLWLYDSLDDQGVPVKREKEGLDSDGLTMERHKANLGVYSAAWTAKIKMISEDKEEEVNLIVYDHRPNPELVVEVSRM